MNKDELLKMARTLGTESGCESCFMFNHQELEDFSNAILERAAVECDELSKCMQQDDHIQGCVDSAHAIRALKTK